MTVLLRKAQPGSDSYGHEWRTPKSVVPVTDEQAAELLKIADAGFTVVTVAEKDDEDEAPGPQPAAEPAAVLEVDPAAADASATAAPKKAAPRRRATEPTA